MQVTFMGLIDSGDGEELEKLNLWGVEFEKGKAVSVEDKRLVAKCEALACFEVASAKAVKPAKTVAAKKAPVTSKL